MPEFLSEEWIEALDEAASRAEVEPDLTLVVEQVVRTGAGERRYQLRFDGGRLRVTSDLSAPADVTFTADRTVASAIATGRRSAQEAFMRGELRVGGDVAGLMAARDALGALGDVFAEVRPTSPG